ncbi:hypothetical protein [Streptomyces sp. NPDC058385]|uniref:hypothetical protein n=1 Tax=Streptomyces sp. NPDC058385 TaxID=3346473 RepID=UPI0036662E18
MRTARRGHRPAPRTPRLAAAHPTERILLALVDASVHRLPDALPLPLAGVALALLDAATLGSAFLLMFLISPDQWGSAT